VTPRAVTQLVDALEGEDLVRRTAHPTDRRITMIDITGDGARVEEQFAALQASLVDLFADLDDADAAALQRSFAAILERMERRAAAPA
jgi:DNA-binding MarR family transcriptional regulator